LRELGADLGRIAVIADDVDAIASEVRRCSEQFDWVVTSGGVGPTHDDITLESVAAGFGVGMTREPALVALLEKYGLELNDATLRMATVPDGCELVEGDGRSFPVLKVRNVFVLPGVPKLFKAKFEVIAPLFAGVAVQTARVRTKARETDIAAHLSAVQDAHPEVEIGSYPRFGEGDDHVIITLESRDAAALESARMAVQAGVSRLDSQ